MSKYIMALDAGTTSNRCILFDKGGNICSMAQKEFRQIFPKPGWVEHDPMEIYAHLDMTHDRLVQRSVEDLKDFRSSDRISAVSETFLKIISSRVKMNGLI